MRINGDTARVNTGVHLRATRADAVTDAECGATDGIAVDCDSADYEARGICGFCIEDRNFLRDMAGGNCDD